MHTEKRDLHLALTLESFTTLSVMFFNEKEAIAYKLSKTVGITRKHFANELVRIDELQQDLSVAWCNAKKHTTPNT